MNLVYVIKVLWWALLWLVCIAISISIAPIVWLFLPKSFSYHLPYWFAWRPVVIELENDWSYPVWLVWVKLTHVQLSREDYYIRIERDDRKERT